MCVCVCVCVCVCDFTNIVKSAFYPKDQTGLKY